jgi:hypothetical protein
MTHTSRGLSCFRYYHSPKIIKRHLVTLWFWDECKLSADGILESDEVKMEGEWKWETLSDSYIYI